MKFRNLKHKYGAKRTVKDSISFPSKLEAKVYQTLKTLQQSGKILFFLRQIPVDLPGKTKHHIDFLVFSHEHCYFIEAKGRDLEAGKLRRKQAEEILGVDIHVVTDPLQIYSVLDGVSES